MKRTLLIVAGALAVAGLFYLTRPGHAPAGQEPLVEVSGSVFPTLQAEFNRNSGLRIILLLSPT